MLKITDFKTLLEIAFGLNVLYYILELIPSAEDRFKELYEQQKELYDRKVKAAKSIEVFPLGLDAGAVYSARKKFLNILTIFTSLLLLGMLLYSAFHSDAEIGLRSVSILLVFVYGGPLIAFRVRRNAITWIATVNRSLQKQIEEIDRNGTKCQLPIASQRMTVNTDAGSIPAVMSQLMADPNITIHISGRRKAGFTFVFEEQDSSCAYKSTRYHSKDETVEILLSFLEGSIKREN